MGSDPIIAESARKHGVSDEDIEVGVVQGETTPVIIPAMQAREKFLR